MTDRIENFNLWKGKTFKKNFNYISRSSFGRNYSLFPLHPFLSSMFIVQTKYFITSGNGRHRNMNLESWSEVKI